MDDNKWSKSLRRRIIAMAVVVGILFLLFLLRLIQFQFIEKGRLPAGTLPESSSVSSSLSGGSTV